MSYGIRHRQDSIPVVFPLLLATGALSLLAIVWRQRSAPRHERNLLPNAASRRLRRASERLDTGDGTQLASGGSGALIHRRYEIALPNSAVSHDIVLRLMQLHLTEFAPATLARFEKRVGSDQLFRVGDEYEITMLGPWNGRVRVAEMTQDSFTLVTLEGHPEAGHITFSVQDDTNSAGQLLVRIESLARSRHAIVAAADGALRVGKRVQTEVWITFLQRFALLAGVSTRPEVGITTESLPDATTVPPRDA